MTGNSKDDCKSQLKQIAKDHAPYLSSWKPTEPDGATFYRLIPERYYNEKSSRIDRPAIADAGFSVYASGGKFGDLDIKQKIIERNKTDLPKVVGAIKIEATVFTSEQFGKFEIKHDPHPFVYKGIKTEQDPNHVCVICIKSEELVDQLIDEPDWAVKPDEI